MWYYIYSLLLTIIAFIAIPFLFIKMLLTGKYKKGLFNYFGFFPKKTVKLLKNSKFIWIHAVSVGELKAVIPVIKNLNGYNYFVTTTCEDAVEMIKKNFPEAIDICYFPLDIPIIMKKVSNIINPECILIAETDYWPNFLYFYKKKNIPIYIINCRVSKKAFKAYNFFYKFSKTLHSNITKIFCQTKIDKQRLLNIGVSPKKIEVTGNTKLDEILNERPISEKYKIFNKRSFVCGSTHNGEEEILLKAIKEFNEKYPNQKILCVIAPRNLNRINEIENLVLTQNLKYKKWSEIIGNENIDIIIGDTMGDLVSFYQYSDIVFVGGSLVNKGCHNLFEPVLAEKPVITGPDQTNFKDIADILKNKGCLFIIKDKNSLIKILEKLFNNDIILNEIKDELKKIVDNSKGLSLKIAENINL